MAGYQKIIAYLDYLENGMKIKNAGFVRIEENGGRMRLEMRVKNIPESFNGQYELKADAGGTAGRISLSRGCGSCCIVWDEKSIIPEGKQRMQSNGVYIRLPGRHLLQAVWQVPVMLLVETEGQEEREDQAQERAQERVQEPLGGLPGEKESCETGRLLSDEEKNAEAKLPEKEEKGQTETPKREEEKGQTELPKREEEKGQTETPKREEEKGQTEASKREETAETGKGSLQEYRMEDPETVDVLQEREESAAQSLKEPVCYGDKWEQLTHMYIQIHPFQDERVYLSIEPKDFVVLRQEYQKMVHNSFLLHGYYNYKHLILGKIREKNEWHYYLGVPGNFYNREKMVAEMFGFEAFEGGRSPARPGDFGYFMKRVEI